MEKNRPSRKKPIQDGTVSARQLALHRVAVREYGSGEMRAYLVRKGATPTEAIRIVGELIRDGQINDGRYARVIARHHAFRGKGPAYVLARLRQKGVRLGLTEVQTIYRDNLPDRFESELSLAHEIVTRRYPRARVDRGVRKRAYGALLRRGFSKNVVRLCLFQPECGGTVEADDAESENSVD